MIFPVTVVSLVGLIFRPRPSVFGIGVDSPTVVALYGLGTGGLVAIGRT